MHTIRLRGAWVVTTAGAITRHSRNFGWPRPLDPGDQLWLVCSHVPGQAEVLLNDQVVGAIPIAGPFACEITQAAHPRNVVVFAVSSGDVLGEVTLEVRHPPL